MSLYIADDVAATTHHEAGLQTNYISSPGDFTVATTFTGTPFQSFLFLTGVEVRSSDEGRAVVALGDSLTEGFGSTPDTNQRWTNLLADRLQSRRSTSHVAVLNAGIGGNRILHDLVGTSALTRLDRDVLVQTGAKYLIVVQGNVDMQAPARPGWNPDAERDRSTDHPGAPADHHARPGHGHARVRRHAQPRRWIPVPGLLDAGHGAETAGGQSVDPDERCVQRRDRFRCGAAGPGAAIAPATQYDGGDHVHPNNLGYRALASAIDLSLFREDDEDD